MCLKIFMVVALVCCGSAAVSAKTIKIAVPSPFTGDAAAYGENVKAGVEMKLEEVNAAGGVNGNKVQAVWLDEQCAGKEAATVAPKIVGNKDIVAIVGHLCSGAHLAALPTYVRGGIAAVSPTATNPTISEKNKDRKGNVWSYRVVYRDDFQGAFLARYAKDILGLKKVGVMYQNDDYGIGLKNGFTNEAEAIKLEVVGEEAYTRGAGTDFKPQLTKLKAKGVEGLFLSGYYNEGALIAKQAKDLGMDVAIMGGEGLDNPDYMNLAGAAAENTYVTTPFLEDAAGPEAKAFLKKFAEKYQRQSDYMSVNSYDATGLIVEAVKAVGADRDKIREYLFNIDTIEEAYEGIGGKVYFNEVGDCEKAAFVKVVKDGKFVAAKQMN
jgi:branched-chain amino acid transport system substrate-binding protein